MAMTMQSKSSMSARTMLTWVGVAGVGVAVAAFGMFSYRAYSAGVVNASDGCLVNVPAPATMILINDGSDRLAGSAPRRWSASVGDALAGLPTGSKVYITRIGSDVPIEVTFSPMPCVPPEGTTKSERILRDRFSARLNGVKWDLENAPTMAHSAISETILAAAEDHDIMAARGKLFIIASDLLENTATASAYRRKGLRLPAIDGRPFAGAVVRFVVLHNTRDSRFQTKPLLDSWAAWARGGAAARVEIDAPWLGYVIMDHVNGKEPPQ